MIGEGCRRWISADMMTWYNKLRIVLRPSAFVRTFVFMRWRRWLAKRGFTIQSELVACRRGAWCGEYGTPGSFGPRGSSQRTSTSNCVLSAVDWRSSRCPDGRLSWLCIFDTARNLNCYFHYTIDFVRGFQFLRHWFQYTKNSARGTQKIKKKNIIERTKRLAAKFFFFV